MQKNGYFIPSEWLDAVKDGRFYYPSASYDMNDALNVFGPHLKEFIFCDINYRRGLRLDQALNDRDGFKLIEKFTKGDPDSILRENMDHRDIEPSWLIEKYENLQTGRNIRVIRRRGFGQYGLLDFPYHSLSVFMHRGDSRGDGGSNVFYLCNLNSRHEQCGNLLSKILERLTDQAIILSDGSNVYFSHEPVDYIYQLTRFAYNQGITCSEAFDALKDETFSYGGFKWKCIGYLGMKNGPTMAWGLTRLEGGD